MQHVNQALASTSDDAIHSDGLHLTAAAYAIVFCQIMAIINSIWPELDPVANELTLRGVPL